jgi:L-aspartate oxidase
LKERTPVDVPTLNVPNLQTLMWEKVGIIRSGNGLAEAADILCTWQKKVPVPSDRPSWQLYNMVLNARLITESALLREESRGAHLRTDFPESSPPWVKHIIFKSC